MSAFVSGSIYVRTIGDEEGVLPGTAIAVHSHSFDHTSIFFCGDWHVKKWTPQGELEHDFIKTAPFHVLVDKDCGHEFTFIGGAERGKAWCVFSHRTPDGEVSEINTGWHGAYGMKGV